MNVTEAYKQIVDKFDDDFEEFCETLLSMHEAQIISDGDFIGIGCEIADRLNEREKGADENEYKVVYKVLHLALIHRVIDKKQTNSVDIIVD